MEVNELGGVETSTSLVKLEESARRKGQRYTAPPREMIGGIDPLISSGPRTETVLIRGLIRGSQWGAECIPPPTGTDGADG